MLVPARPPAEAEEGNGPALRVRQTRINGLSSSPPPQPRFRHNKEPEMAVPRDFEAQTASSGTLVDLTDSGRSPQGAGINLTKALIAAKLPKVGSANTEGSAPSNKAGLPADTAFPSPSPRRARLSLSPPADIHHASGSQTTGLGARSAQEKVRDLFDRVRANYPLEESPPSSATEGSRLRTPAVPSTTARDRARTARTQKALGLSAGSRERPARAMDPAKVSEGSELRQRDATRYRRDVLHASDLEDEDGSEDSDSEREGLKFGRSSAALAATPHPPGHLSFQDNSPLRGPIPPPFARASFSRVPDAELEFVGHDPGATGRSSEGVSVRTLPSTPPARRRDVQSTGRAPVLSPRKAVARGASIISRLRESLANEEAAFRAEQQNEQELQRKADQREVLRHQEAELRAKLARLEPLLTAPDTLGLESERSVSPDSISVTDEHRARGAWPILVAGILLFTLLTGFIRWYADNIWRHEYFEGLVPPMPVIPLDWLPNHITPSTLQSFGISHKRGLRALWLTTTHVIRARLLEIIEMPPSGYRIPT